MKDRQSNHTVFKTLAVAGLIFATAKCLHHKARLKGYGPDPELMAKRWHKFHGGDPEMMARHARFHRRKHPWFRHREECRGEESETAETSETAADVEPPEAKAAATA
jgi:hypothetical protein